MRCFVAIKAGDAIRRRVAEVQEALARAEADVRWVKLEGLHLTLKFLGEMDEPRVEELRGLLRAEAPRWPAMRLDYAGLGTFPDRGVPRVVWAGATGDVAKLAGLAQAAERAAERVGVARENRPFVAHLTIGRVNSPRNAKRLMAAIDQQRRVLLGPDPVCEFILYQSTLAPEGPIYDSVEAFPLSS